jgi:hypothetical protein
MLRALMMKKKKSSAMKIEGEQKLYFFFNLRSRKGWVIKVIPQPL